MLHKANTLPRLNKQSKRRFHGEHAGTKYSVTSCDVAFPERYPETVLADMLIPEVPFSGPLPVSGDIDFDFVFDVNDGVNSVSRGVS